MINNLGLNGGRYHAPGLNHNIGTKQQLEIRGRGGLPSNGLVNNDRIFDLEQNALMRIQGRTSSSNLDQTDSETMDSRSIGSSEGDKKYVDDKSELNEMDFGEDDSDIESETFSDDQIDSNKSDPFLTNEVDVDNTEERREPASDYFKYHMYHSHWIDLEIVSRGDVFPNLHLTAEDDVYKYYRFNAGWVLIGAYQCFVCRDGQEESFWLDDIYVKWKATRIGYDKKLGIDEKIVRYFSKLGKPESNPAREQFLVPVMNNQSSRLEDVYENTIPIFIDSDDSNDYLSAKITFLVASQFEGSNKLTIILPIDYLTKENGDWAIKFLNEIQSLFFGFYNNKVSDTQAKFVRLIEFKVFDGKKLNPLNDYRMQLDRLIGESTPKCRQAIFNYLHNHLQPRNQAVRDQISLKDYFNHDRLSPEQAQKFKTKNKLEIDNLLSDVDKYEENIESHENQIQTLKAQKISLLPKLLVANYYMNEANLSYEDSLTAGKTNVDYHAQQLQKLRDKQIEAFRQHDDLSGNIALLRQQTRALETAKKNFEEVNKNKQIEVRKAKMNVDKLILKYNNLSLKIFFYIWKMKHETLDGGENNPEVNRFLKDLNAKVEDIGTMSMVLFDPKKFKLNEYLLLIWYLIFNLIAQKERFNRIEQLELDLRERKY